MYYVGRCQFILYYKKTLYTILADIILYYRVLVDVGSIKLLVDISLLRLLIDNGFAKVTGRYWPHKKIPIEDGLGSVLEVFTKRWLSNIILTFFITNKKV